MSAITLLIFVAKEKDERAEPFVVGAFNAEFMNDLPYEDGEEQIEKLKATWTGEPDAYEWRTCTVRLDEEEVEELFEVPEVNAYWER